MHKNWYNWNHEGNSLSQNSSKSHRIELQKTYMYIWLTATWQFVYLICHQPTAYSFCTIKPLRQHAFSAINMGWRWILAILRTNSVPRLRWITNHILLLADLVMSVEICNAISKRWHNGTFHAGMLSPREAKFCGLGLVKHWHRSRVCWPRDLNKFLCYTLN